MAEHGKRSTYVRGCRCRACTDANHAYENRRHRLMVYGTWAPDRVPAEPVRAHVAQLRAHGMGKRTIAEVSGVALSSIAGLERSGKTGAPARYVSRDTAERLLAVRYRRPNGARVIGVGTMRRLQALNRNGWPLATLGERFGWSGSNVSKLMTGSPVRKDTAMKVLLLFEELKYRRGPSDLARTRAARRGWPYPDQWDGIDMDDPKSRPKE